MSLIYNYDNADGMISIYMFLSHPQIVYVVKKLNNS